MSKIILHIGLHKTATKYLQHHVFPFLDKEKFIYNPDRLDQYLLDYLKAFEEDKEDVHKVLIKELNKLIKDSPNKTILISREGMSGNLFTAYKYWDKTVKLLKDCFPGAKIIFSLRYQVDWLVSCYRESLHEHHYQTIDEFLNYDQESKAFKNPQGSRNDSGYAHLNALGLNYSEMLNQLFKNFDHRDTFVYFYENFKSNKEEVTEKILSFIGSKPVETKPMLGIPNRGYSALSIELTLRRASILKDMGLNNKLDRPIFFYGKKSIPSGKMELSLLDKDKYWGSDFLRNNEEVRSLNYPNLSPVEKESYESSWRYIVKMVLDKNDYIDWDIIAHLRPSLNDFYRNLNKTLLSYFDKEEIPNCYL